MRPCPSFSLVPWVDRQGGAGLHMAPWLPTPPLPQGSRQGSGQMPATTPKWPLPQQVPGRRGHASLEGISCAQAPPYGNEGQVAGAPTCCSTRAGRAEMLHLAPAPSPGPAPSFLLGERCCLTPQSTHLLWCPTGGHVLGSTRCRMLINKVT